MPRAKAAKAAKADSKGQRVTAAGVLVGKPAKGAGPIAEVEIIRAPGTETKAQAVAREKREDEVQKANEEMARVRFTEGKKQHEELFKQLSDADRALIEEGAKATIHNPTSEYLEGSFNAVTYYVGPGDTEIVSVQPGVSSEAVAQAVAGQLAGHGLTVKTEKGKKDDLREELRGGRIVTGRGGLTGYSLEEIEALEGVENPPAGARLQPRHLPNSPQWTPEQLKQARVGDGNDKVFDPLLAEGAVRRLAGRPNPRGQASAAVVNRGKGKEKPLRGQASAAVVNRGKGKVKKEK